MFGFYLPCLQVIAVSLLALWSFPSIKTVQLETKSTIYHGVESKSGKLAIFYGIPYAKPPVGARRWRAPVPLDPVVENAKDKVSIKAQNKPAFCIQGPTDFGEIPVLHWDVILMLE